MKLLFSFRYSLLFSFIIMMSASSCKQEEKPVTADEAKDFARQLQISIEKREPDFFNSAVDKTKFLKKAGLGTGENARAFESGLDERLSMGNAITKALSKKGTYQLVKQYEKDKTQHVLFRLYDNGSLNYHDIELTKSGGKVKFADIFIYTSGEYLSETIKGVYDQIKDMGDKKPSDENNWIKRMPEMRQLMTEGKSAEALVIYNQLPAEIQKLRAVQIIHVLLTSAIDDTEQYGQAIEEYQRLYPNEPNMYLLLLDGYILKKEYDQALSAVNELDKMINKDPFLDYYRYLIYNLKEDTTNSKISIERLMKNMPGFEDGMIEIIAVYLEEKNKTAADEWIEKYKQNSLFDQDKLQMIINKYED